MKKIISIQGYKNSGKDEVAKYIKYIISNPKILQFYWFAKLINFSTFFSKWKIICYAEKIKEMLSILINENRLKFEERDFKENFYFDFKNYKLYNINYCKDKILTDKSFNNQLTKKSPLLINEHYYSIRQIMQYFGTEIMRKTFGDQIWILSTFNSGDYLIISDQRFEIENKLVKQNNGYIIHITRPNSNPGFHSSEKELTSLLETKSYDSLINNDSSLKNLFNNCKKIINYEYTKIM